MSLPNSSQFHLAHYPGLQERNVLGLISGTSADGVDVATVKFFPEAEEARLKLLRFETVPYPESLKERVLAASQDLITLRQTAVLHTDLGEFFAEVASSALAHHDCCLIGSHGQTVCHLPDLRTTLQIGDGAIIAARTGVTTVSDFRPADMALGGQGAPLVPVFDAYVLAHSERVRVAVNLGGIANITLVAPNAQAVRAWDTGPANCVSDALCRLNGSGDFDPEGTIAARGTVDQELLQKLLKEPYFQLPPPKSTGLEDFGREFTQHWFSYGSLPDMLRTALALSAETLVESIFSSLQDESYPAVDVVFAGGGTGNQTLMNEIRQRLFERADRQDLVCPEVLSFQDFGISEDAREAVAFAYLADLTARGIPGSLPSTTGASQAAVLGKVSFPSP